MAKYGLTKTEIKLLARQRELRILTLMNDTDIYMPLVPNVEMFGGPSAEDHRNMIREEIKNRCDTLRDSMAKLSSRLDDMRSRY